MKLKSISGFTLVELLIAIIIFALISAMAYGGLNSVLTSHKILSQQQQQFQAVVKVLFQFQRELRHIVPRPITNNFNSIEPALVLTQDSEVLFSFTHAGVINVMGTKTMPLQRIDYFFSQGELKKRTWITLDNSDNSNFKEKTLLSDLKQFKVEVLGRDGQWYHYWPDKQDPVDLLPMAIRLVLVTENYGEISRLLDLPQ